MTVTSEEEDREADELTLGLSEEIGRVADRLNDLYRMATIAAVLLFVLTVEMVIRIAQG